MQMNKVRWAGAVVMLTVSEDAEDLTAALKAGARGYLLKNIDADFLKQAVVRAAAGSACSRRSRGCGKSASASRAISTSSITSRTAAIGAARSRRASMA